MNLCANAKFHLAFCTLLITICYVECLKTSLTLAVLVFGKRKKIRISIHFTPLNQTFFRFLFSRRWQSRDPMTFSPSNERVFLGNRLAGRTFWRQSSITSYFFLASSFSTWGCCGAQVRQQQQSGTRAEHGGICDSVQEGATLRRRAVGQQERVRPFRNDVNKRPLKKYTLDFVWLLPSVWIWPKV